VLTGAIAFCVLCIVAVVVTSRRGLDRLFGVACFVGLLDVLVISQLAIWIYRRPGLQGKLSVGKEIALFFGFLLLAAAVVIFFGFVCVGLTVP
jgi:hypothetical protein